MRFFLCGGGCFAPSRPGLELENLNPRTVPIMTAIAALLPAQNNPYLLKGLVQRIRVLHKKSSVEPYLPQLCYTLMRLSDRKALLKFLLQKSATSVHFGIQFLMFLFGMWTDADMARRTSISRMMKKVHSAIITRSLKKCVVDDWLFHSTISRHPNLNFLSFLEKTSEDLSAPSAEFLKEEREEKQRQFALKKKIELSISSSSSKRNNNNSLLGSESPDTALVSADATTTGGGGGGGSGGGGGGGGGGDGNGSFFFGNTTSDEEDLRRGSVAESNDECLARQGRWEPPKWLSRGARLRLAFVEREMHFVDIITQVSENLRRHPQREQRLNLLQAQLESINACVPPTAYIPLAASIENYRRVVRIIAQEARVFSTHTRAPYMLLVEVIRSSSNLKKPNVRPRVRHPPNHPQAGLVSPSSPTAHLLHPPHLLTSAEIMEKSSEIREISAQKLQEIEEKAKGGVRKLTRKVSEAMRAAGAGGAGGGGGGGGGSGGGGKEGRGGGGGGKVSLVRGGITTEEESSGIDSGDSHSDGSEETGGEDDDEVGAVDDAGRSSVDGLFARGASQRLSRHASNRPNRQHGLRRHRSKSANVAPSENKNSSIGNNGDVKNNSNNSNSNNYNYNSSSGVDSDNYESDASRRGKSRAQRSMSASQVGSQLVSLTVSASSSPSPLPSPSPKRGGGGGVESLSTLSPKRMGNGNAINGSSSSTNNNGVNGVNGVNNSGDLVDGAGVKSEIEIEMAETRRKGAELVRSESREVLSPIGETDGASPRRSEEISRDPSRPAPVRRHSFGSAAMHIMFLRSESVPIVHSEPIESVKPIPLLRARSQTLNSIPMSPTPANSSALPPPNFSSLHTTFSSLSLSAPTFQQNKDAKKEKEISFQKMSTASIMKKIEQHLDSPPSPAPDLVTSVSGATPAAPPPASVASSTPSLVKRLSLSLSSRHHDDQMQSKILSQPPPSDNESDGFGGGGGGGGGGGIFAKEVEETEGEEEEIRREEEEEEMDANRRDTLLHAIEKQEGNADFYSSNNKMSVFGGEGWEERKQRLRRESPYGKEKGWELLCFVVKSFDDLRQEVFAMQLIKIIWKIWQEAHVPVFVRSYGICATSANTGFIEGITDAISLDGLKKTPGYVSLKDHFTKTYGPPSSVAYEEAAARFCDSLAGYSILSYLLQIKDRHNGNILLDHLGHLVHIDFGFFLSNSPGGMNFENAPFKLTAEMVDLLGGHSPPSPLYRRYSAACIAAFLAARERYLEIVQLTETMYNAVGEQWPCFRAGRHTVETLRDRFVVHLSTKQVVNHVVKMIEKSRDNWRTRQYDSFQRMQNGIIP